MSSSKLSNALQSVSAQISNLSHAITTGKIGTSTDARIFASSKRGELSEWKQQLNSPQRDKKKAAVKSVIAAMTLGKDVSSLFPEVVNCMQTTNLELKKLVYLYVINFARTRPELAVLAVNTFRKDTLDPNPLVRALAVRTMGSIRLQQMTEYLIEPLNRLCRDSDPYVRKTAVIAVGKLYDTSPEAARENGFIDLLQDMMNDSNPVVVANVIATLDEISEISETDLLEYSSDVVSKLLLALPDCSEWGQVIILDSIAARYECSTQSEAEVLIERLTSRLNHANPGVVISCTRLLFKLLEEIENENLQKTTIHKKILPPLYSLLSSESPELQFVILKNLQILCQKFPGLLNTECRLFFVKFNDPFYIKFEKLDLLVRCVCAENVDLIIQELCEYASEVDIEFVKRSIRCLGRLALMFDSIVEKVLRRLTDLMETGINFILEEIVIVLRDLFRKFPNRYEGVLTSLMQQASSIEDPESRASFVWMMGEYCDKLPGAENIIKHFISVFLDETTIVQYQVLTAALKLFLKIPANNQQTVMNILKLATEESESPDLRDRSYLYWRILTQDTAIAKQIICCNKPPIKVQMLHLNPDLLDTLMKNVGLLASVYHQDPSVFIARLKDKKQESPDLGNDDSDDENKIIETSEIKHRMAEVAQYDTSNDSNPDEEDNGDADSSSGSGASSSSSSDSETRERPSEPAASTLKRPLPPRIVLLPLTNGLSIEGCTTRINGFCALLVRIHNKTDIKIGPYALVLEPNSFGFQIDRCPALERAETQPQGYSDIPMKLLPDLNPSNQPPSTPLILRAHISTPQLGSIPFNIPFDFINVFVEKAAVSKNEYKDHWLRMTEQKQVQFWAVSNTGAPISKSQAVSTMDLYNIKLVTEAAGPNHVKLYLSAVTTNNLLLLLEVSLQQNGPGICITMRADAQPIFGSVAQSLCTYLNATPSKARTPPSVSTSSTSPPPLL